MRTEFGDDHLPLLFQSGKFLIIKVDYRQGRSDAMLHHWYCMHWIGEIDHFILHVK